MKIDILKIVELEEKYKGSIMAINTIQQMINIVLDNYGDNLKMSLNYLLALSTLKELGIIKE